MWDFQLAHLVLHLVLGTWLAPLLGLLLLLGLRGLATSLTVGTTGGVSLLGPDCHTQPVVGRLHLLVGVGGPTHWEGGVPVVGEEGGVRNIRNRLLLWS